MLKNTPSVDFSCDLHSELFDKRAKLKISQFIENFRAVETLRVDLTLFLRYKEIFDIFGFMIVYFILLRNILV